MDTNQVFFNHIPFESLQEHLPDNPHKLHVLVVIHHHSKENLISHVLFSRGYTLTGINLYRGSTITSVEFLTTRDVIYLLQKKGVPLELNALVPAANQLLQKTISPNQELTNKWKTHDIPREKTTKFLIRLVGTDQEGYFMHFGELSEEERSLLPDNPKTYFAHSTLEEVQEVMALSTVIATFS